MGGGYSYTNYGGYLHIETNSRNFQAGEAVQGVIHLYLSRPVQIRTLILKFKGVELGMWNPEGTGYEEIINRAHFHRHCTGRGHTISQRFPIFSFNYDFTGPGQFSFPFTFVLPSDIPGSFHLEYGNVYGRITYSLIAIMDGPMDEVEKHSLHIHVNQLMTNPIYGMSDAQLFTVMAGCCSNQGLVELRVLFSKNAFAPGERVELIVEANNTNCRKAIIGFEADLFRTVRITNEFGGTYVEKEFLRMSSHLQRVPPSTSLLGESSVRMGISIDDYRHDILHAVSVHSRYIDCTYSVAVRALIEGGTCGGDPPQVERHLQIYPRQLPIMQPRYMPDSWNPQLMQSVQFVAGTQYHYEPSSPIDHRERINII